MDEEIRVCSTCGCVLHEDETIEVDGDPICNDCADEHTTTCDHCGETIWADDSISDGRLSLRFNSDEDLLDERNDEIILKCAAQSDVIIIAWGSAGHNSQRVRDRQAELLELLKPFSNKLKIITDGGETAYHPLSPTVRECWQLKEYKG